MFPPWPDWLLVVLVVFGIGTIVVVTAVRLLPVLLPRSTSPAPARMVFEYSGGPELDEMDPRLVSLLRVAGGEWGPLGVARAAVKVYAAHTVVPAAYTTAGARPAEVSDPPGAPSAGHLLAVMRAHDDKFADMPRVDAKPMPIPADHPDDKVSGLGRAGWDHLFGFRLSGWQWAVLRSWRHDAAVRPLNPEVSTPQ